MSPRDANAASGGPRQPKRDHDSWRKEGKRSPAGARSAGTSRAWWSVRQRKSDEQVSFRTKVALSVITLLALVGALVRVVWRPHHQVPLIALTVTNYRSELLPLNGWTQEDVIRFKDIADDDGDSWFGSSRGEISWPDDPSSPGGAPTELNRADDFKDALKAYLNEVQPGNNPDTAIVYISAHGAVDDDHKPCLLLGYSNPHDPGKPGKRDAWLRVEEIFRIIEGSSRVGTTLVVFDSNRMASNAACGLLYQDFASRLEDLVTGLDGAKSIVVINSASDGEIGWEAPELAGSVFGYYFGEGLAGEADENGDGAVTFQELIAYLQNSVDSYVQHRRNSRQLPKLCAPSNARRNWERQEVVHCNRHVSARQIALQADRIEKARQIWGNPEGWQELDGLWRQRDEHKPENAQWMPDKACRLYQLQPVKWSKFERDLIRAEHALMAGKAYEPLAIELLQKAHVFADSNASPRGEVISDHNLPLALQRTGEGGNKDLRDAVAEWDKLTTNPSLDLVALRGFAERQRTALSVLPIEVHFAAMLGGHLEPTREAGPPELLQAALTARRLAEVASSPWDKRTIPWFQAEVDRGDQLRRGAEDILFVGPGSTSDEADWLKAELTKYGDANQEYGRAKEHADQIANAYYLRDVGAVDIPHLADWSWQSLELQRIFPESGDDETKIDDLRKAALNADLARVGMVAELIKDWESLTELLAGKPTTNEDSRKRIVNAAAKFRDKLGVARDSVKQLAKSGPGEQYRVGVIQRHLAYPLLTAATREEIRGEVMRQMSKYAVERYSTGGKADLLKFEQPPDNLLDKHPYFLWIPPSSADEDKAFSQESLRDRFDAQGKFVREQLRGAPSGLVAFLENYHKELLNVRSFESRLREELAPGDIHALRKPLAAGDLVVRKVAAWHDDWPTSTQDKLVDHPNVERLRHFDLHQLMIWQARRTLDDFWGGDDAAKPFFDVAAESYLNRDKLTSEDKRLWAYSEWLLDQRREAARQFRQSPSITSSQAVMNTAAPIEVRLDVALPSGDGLPHGVAALYLLADAKQSDSLLLTPAGHSNKQLPGHRIGVPLGKLPEGEKLAGIRTQLPGHGARYDFDAPASASGGSNVVESRLWYRGHTNSHPIRLSPAGVKIEFVAEKIEPAEVRVRSSDRVRTSVMFVFDCSLSMLDPMRSESGASVTRMDAARSTLVNILHQSTMQEFRGGVGLRLYGHRFNFKPRSNDHLLSPYAKEQEAALQAKGQQLAWIHPGADVELVYQVAPLTSTSRGEIESLLQRLRPHGTTPLYHAIRDSLEDPVERGQARRIIVLTDGLNQQQDLPLGEQTTAKTLLSDNIAPRPGITVDVIGFGEDFRTTAGQAQTKDIEELGAVCKKFGGTLYTAQTTKDLLDYLKESLDPGKFNVTPVAAAQQNPGAGELNFNSTWTEDSSLRMRELSARIPYKVTTSGIQGQPSMNILLQGNERIELILDRTGTNLTLAYPRFYYDRRTSDVDALSRDEPPKGIGKVVALGNERYWVCSAVSPFWKDSNRSRTFVVQFQNANLARFTPRPAEAWIEISPLDDDGNPDAEKSYSFCELKFEPRAPVPQIYCEARAFPEQARSARIDVWFSMDRLPPTDTQIVPVNQLVGTGLQVEGSEVRVRAEISSEAVGKGGTIVLHEIRPATLAGKPKAQVKIEFDERRGSPSRCVHDYTLGRHVFEFPEHVVVKDCQVRLIGVERFKQLTTKSHFTLKDDLGKR